MLLYCKERKKTEIRYESQHHNVSYKSIIKIQNAKIIQNINCVVHLTFDKMRIQFHTKQSINNDKHPNLTLLDYVSMQYLIVFTVS